MFRLFDYIYYRVNKAYFKWDGRNGITSILAISMLQVLTIADILIAIAKLSFDKRALTPYSKTIAWIGVLVYGVFVLSNHFKYKNKYNKFKTQWENESEKQKTARGILIVLLLVAPWIILAIIANLL